MITARATRLVRVPDLRAFRDVVVALACEGDPLDARDRLVVVPARAAAAQLVRTIEDERLEDGGALLLPEFVTPREIVRHLAGRLPAGAAILTAAEREVLLGLAARAARTGGAEPPFRLRPGLIAGMLDFYDALRRNEKDVETFERLTLGILEPGAAIDRGAERLVRQTRFLVAAFRDFEQRCASAGRDEHGLRRDLLAGISRRPLRHVVVTVPDRAFDAYGLVPADWDLLARLPGLLRLDIVVTENVLAGALHERMHQLFPGIEEVRPGRETRCDPILRVPAHGGVVHLSRDREEEVAGFARRVRHLAAAGQPLERIALVVRQPLPYAYVARDVLRSGGIPCQLFDALPLAAEPYAAVLDLVFAYARSGFDRVAASALFGSPLLRPLTADEEAKASACLAALAAPAPAAAHLEVLRQFLTAYERPPIQEDPWRARHMRARAAIIGIADALHDAFERFDPAPVPFDDVAATIHRWIEGQTFAPRVGDGGVHIVDAHCAPFGTFDLVQLAGVVEGEWPEPPRRNIFYSSAILRQLGWPAEQDRLHGARAAFSDLLRLPSARTVVTAFTLEADRLVAVSPLAEDVESAGLAHEEEDVPRTRMFEYEALAMAPVVETPFSDTARLWIAHRLAHAAADAPHKGEAGPHRSREYSLSALERYQDCPFKFFASHVLRLEEPAEDESSLSPRARGRFLHEVFERFFLAWDHDEGGTITAERLEAARALFAAVAEPLLERLPESDRPLERTRLFGSAISMGIADVVLGLEASRPGKVQERWLEYRLEGVFALGEEDGRQLPLRGVADRIDLLEGRRLRVIDYKSGQAPNPKRALQVPIYALCAQERLEARDGAAWTIDDAAYVAFGSKRPLVPVVKAGTPSNEVLSAARARAHEVVDAIERGEFPARPYDLAICGYCAYASVCRKDYAGD